MKNLRLFSRSALLKGFLFIPLSAHAIVEAKPQEGRQAAAPGLRKLTGSDARRADELKAARDDAILAERWNEATARAGEVVELRTRVQGAKHFETIDAEWSLRTVRSLAVMTPEDRRVYESTKTISPQAGALWAKGKYAEAQPLFENILAIHRRLLTDEHPYTAQSYNNLAACLSAQGKHAEAEAMYNKALEIDRRTLSDDHPQTASVFNNQAVNIGAQGRYAQAQPFYERALELYRRLQTDNHPETALAYHNLALNLNAMGKFAEAQPVFEKALSIRRSLFGDDDNATATSYNGLALSLDVQGKFAQAQPLYEKALEIHRRVLTDEHPETATGYNNLGGLLSDMGKHAEAQPLLEKALAIRRRIFTDEHAETAVSYNALARNLKNQRKYAQAQPLYEKAIEIFERRLTAEHSETASCYNNLAMNLSAQGKHAAAQPLFEKALEARRRALGDNHPETARSFNNIAFELYAQGKFLEARDRWKSAVKSLDSARLRVAFTGLDRTARSTNSARLALAAVDARLGHPAEAWQSLEEDLGRGLLDELAARQDQRLSSAERGRLRELTTALERLDKLAETSPKNLDHGERAKRFEDLNRQREQASIDLGEFQTKLVKEHGPLAGRVATLLEIQPALPDDAALVAWVDVRSDSPNAAAPDGEHWGVVVRSRGVPNWVPIVGTGPERGWTKDELELALRVRTGLMHRPEAATANLASQIDSFRAQRLDPLAKALGASTDVQPRARRLIVLPSTAMAGIPIEAILARDDDRTVSYVSSATVFKYLREQTRPDRHAGLLALGDPVYKHPDESSRPPSLPDHGLFISVVVPGSNAAKNGLEPGDVLLAYNGTMLNKKDDLKVVAEGEKPVAIEVWRDGRRSTHDLARGKLGVVIDARPAPEAIAASRAINKVLTAARSGDGEFAQLPGTRYEVEMLARLFQSDDRPTRILLGTDASEQELDHIAASGELSRFGFIHLATHGVVDEAIPQRSAVILTQTDLPDPLTQVLNHKPAFDGRLSVREIQRGWELKAELVTLSACETALGREAGGEGFVGFTQAFLMSGARSVCLSLWKVDDTATALLMRRFYANLLGRRTGLTSAMPKAEALREAKLWLRALRRSEALAMTAELSGGVERGKGNKARLLVDLAAAVPAGDDNDLPYASPHFWAAFVLAGDPD